MLTWNFKQPTFYDSPLLTLWLVFLCFHTVVLTSTRRKLCRPLTKVQVRRYSLLRTTAWKARLWYLAPSSGNSSTGVKTISFTTALTDASGPPSRNSLQHTLYITEPLPCALALSHSLYLPHSLARTHTHTNPSSDQTTLPSNALQSGPGGGNKALGFRGNYSVCACVQAEAESVSGPPQVYVCSLRVRTCSE